MNTILSILKNKWLWIGILITAMAVTIWVMAADIKKLQVNQQRYRDNQTALLSEIEQYRTKNGELAERIQAITLRADELETLVPDLTNEIANLKLKLKNVQSVARVSMRSDVTATMPVKDSEVPKSKDDSLPSAQASRDFEWKDDYITIKGILTNDSVKCAVAVKDTLILVAHRKPRKCIFRRKGKIINYSVESKNPHTLIGDVQYIEVLDE